MISDDDAALESLEKTSPGQLSLEQLRGFHQGIAATIMPVRGGWRVHYFSIPNFDEEPGTTFPSFESALAAVEDVLPAVNSAEERGRANQELRERLRDSTDESPAVNDPNDPRERSGDT